MTRIYKFRHAKHILSLLLVFCMTLALLPIRESALATEGSIPQPTDLKLFEKNSKIYAQWNSHRTELIHQKGDTDSYDLRYDLEVYRAGNDSYVYAVEGSIYTGESDTEELDLNDYFGDTKQNGGYYFKVRSVEIKNNEKTENFSKWASNSDALFWIGEDNSEIKKVEINNALLDYVDGDSPKAKAFSDDERYEVSYERWEEMSEKENGELEPVAYWYSNGNYHTGAKKIEAFEEGKLYQYSFSLKTKEGFKFGDNLTIKLNDEELNGKGMISIDHERKTCYVDTLKSFRPIKIKVLDTIEINNATLSFKVGDKPVFTGKVPEGAPYNIDHEGWESENTGWTSSDFWNRRYSEDDSEKSWGKPLKEFEKGQKYFYRIYLKMNYKSGYRFDKNQTKLKINGQVINFDNPSDIGIDVGDTAWFSNVISMIPKIPENDTSPKIIEGENSKWNPSSEEGLKFRSNASYLSFSGVLIDGSELDSKYYDKKSGSIIVELKPEYLKMLSEGKHTITIKSTEGDASTDFIIESNTSLNEESEGTSVSPKTGDNRNIVLWLTIVFISGGLFSLMMILNKKKSKCLK